MLSIDRSSKRVAYNTFIAMTKSITPQGIVPNGAAAMWRSWDRTEPPVGAKILHEMWVRWGDKWVVEATFDELMAWNDWFWRRRRLMPLGMICLGSDLNPGADADPLAGTHIGATLESGLDNSPMYCDCPPSVR
jgi:putative isomerase